MHGLDRAPNYLALEAVYRMGWYLWARNEMDDFANAKEFFSMQLGARIALDRLRSCWTNAIMQGIEELLREYESKK